ncbi:DNA internalization-related competence protein ComEC/Rec2 [Thalassobacillus devorans]|uniref:DNA internalization-related competence protein ComEC/Rec2 n=1 Tax=Thalassobacillus devorans TaxID=279813 RepID=UPI0004B0388A|nr:DNA internalization-related competence protein ComEC/Rec2 [Thalassobacillus devorans]
MRGYWHIFAVAFVLGGLTFSSWQEGTAIIYITLLLTGLFIMKPSKHRMIMIGSFYLLGGLIVTGDPPAPGKPGPVITGELATIPNETDNSIEVVMKVTDSKQKVLLTAFVENSSASVTALTADWQHGAVCQVQSAVSLPPSATNPGEFDYRDYLSHKGITSQIIINEATQMTCSGSSWLALLYEQRKRLLNAYEENLPDDVFSWLTALVFGNTDGLDNTIIELFRRWNLSHLLAISGLHIGLMIALLLYILYRSGITTVEKSFWFLFFFMPLYALFAGGAPSVLRAVTMALLGMLILKLRLQIRLLDMLSLLLLSFLIINPSYFYHLGFQFSFLVTFAIVLSNTWFNRTSSKLFLLSKISLLSQLIILPLQLFNFFQFNPLSIFINLIYVPYFSFFVIPYMIFLSFFTLFVPGLASLGSEIFLLIHGFFLEVLRQVDTFLYYPWIIGKITPLFSIGYYILLALMMVKLENGEERKAFNTGILVVTLLIIFSLKPYFSKEGTITILDIGQGDSIVVELPYRKGVFLIDAAGPSHFSKNQKRIADNVIRPFLQSKGISDIDAIFLSHEDSDHVGSVPYVIDQFHVEKLITSPYFQFSEALQKKVSEERLRIIRAKGGDSLVLNGQRFAILNPVKDFAETNDNSLVMHTSFGMDTWLFTGDISVKVEQELLNAFPYLQADVLKVAHHGSSTSSSQAFLESLQVKAALISTGKDNRYGHPHKTTIEALSQQEISIFRTDLQGAIQYKYTEDDGTFYTNHTYDRKKR